jgi:predicted nucleic acid-binding Zn ribbon protein
VRSLIPAALPGSDAHDVVTAAADYTKLDRPESNARIRQIFGRIAIANSDSGMGAYTDVAIEQAHRAVHELQRVVA